MERETRIELATNSLEDSTYIDAVPTHGYQSDQPSHLLLPATHAAAYPHAPRNPLTSISGSRLLWVYLTLDKVAPYQKTMVSRAGLEPATTALKVRCSTN